MKLPKGSTVWSSFIDVFDKIYWLIVALCAVCLLIVFYITWNYIENESAYNAFGTSITLVLLSHIGLSLSLNPKKISTRISLLTVCMSGMVLLWIYNSGLTSVLTVDKVDMPIKSLEVKLTVLGTFFYSLKNSYL
jgi:hypothetical protein